jgi:hypothetical protein
MVGSEPRKAARPGGQSIQHILCHELHVFFTCVYFENLSAIVSTTGACVNVGNRHFPVGHRLSDPKAQNVFVRLRKIKKFVSLINILRLAQFKNKGGAYEKADKLHFFCSNDSSSDVGGAGR